jgi:hypothetical protein
MQPAKAVEAYPSKQKKPAKSGAHRPAKKSPFQMYEPRNLTAEQAEAAAVAEATAAELFWSKVRRGPDECWPAPVVRNYNPSRMAWRLTHGTLSSHDVIVPVCGTAACTNPNHLVCTHNPRRMWFDHDPSAEGAQAAADVVRGCLLKRLDDAYEFGELGKLLGGTHEDRGVREQALRLYQAVVSSMFPELFHEDAEVEAAIEAARREKRAAEIGLGLGRRPEAGLIPKSGVERAGPARLIAFAAVLSGKAPAEVRESAGAGRGVA